LGLYYENEEEVTAALLNVRFLEELRDSRALAEEDLRIAARWNGHSEATLGLEYNGLFDAMVRERTLKLLVIISGQGPVAFGMPEQFSPSQYINLNRSLNPLVVMLSDGRYSGVTYGAAVGHVTPEAAKGGGILYLQTGDLFVVRLRERRIDRLDGKAFREGRVEPARDDIAREREVLGKERLRRIWERRQT
jgi:hypothetical protein